MANPYTGTAITNCDSPALNADKDTYTTKLDRTMQVIDEHDHTPGKGNPISTAALQDGAVTQPKLGALNRAASSEIGFNTSGVGGHDTDTTAESVTNGSVAITTQTTRGVKVWLQGYIGSAVEHGLYLTDIVGTGTIYSYYLFLFRDGALIERWLLRAREEVCFPVEIINFEDYGATVGAHTYTLKAGTTNADTKVGIFGCKLLAREL